MSTKAPASPEKKESQNIGTPRRRARLVELMRETPTLAGAGKIDFSEEEIVRFAATRLQIDTDY